MRSSGLSARASRVATSERRGIGPEKIDCDVGAKTQTALSRAKARLDPLELYERPVRIDRVRLACLPWLFKLPWFRRFDGYAMWNLILLRSPELRTDEDLITHELCHVWQMQHRPLRMPLSYLRLGYANNPYEAEARRAAATPAGDSA